MQMSDYLTLLISIIAIAVSFWAAWVTSLQRRNAEKEMALRAYETAISGILDLKKSFADHPDIFDKQLSFDPNIKELIPNYMDSTTFLIYAGGMWRLSFVYTAMKRGEEMGLNKNELKAIEAEMGLWLRDVPGFYDIYVQHTEVLNVHNVDFLNYLKEKVFDTNYRRTAEPGRLVEQA